MSRALPSLETKRCFGHRNNVSAVAWNLDGSKLAAAGDASCILVYDTERLIASTRPETRYLHDLRGHTKNIEAVVCSPTSPNILITAGQDSLVNVFDTRTDGRPVNSITTSSRCLFAGWAPDGNSVAVGDDANNVYIIDCLSWHVRRKIPFDGDVNQFCWSSDGKRILFARGDGSVDVCEWPSLKEIIKIRGHVTACLGIAAHPKNRFIAVCSVDSCVSIWDAKSLVNVFTIDRWNVPTQQVVYSHDGTYLAVAGESEGVDITNSSTGSLMHTIPTSSLLNNMAWHPSRDLLAYAYAPGTGKSGRGDRYPSDSGPATYVWGFTRNERGAA